jgi:hypothetical protein
MGPKSRAAYVAIDLGLRQPTDAEAAILADWLGGYPPDVESGEPGLATHLPGLSDLASAISELVAELRAARQERADLLERVEALETAARLRDRSGAGAAGRPTAPAQRGG